MKSETILSILEKEKILYGDCMEGCSHHKGICGEYAGYGNFCECKK